MDTGTDEGCPEVVVITGASAGVGRSTVREFAGHGAHVALLARNKDGLREAEEEVEAAADRVEEELGPIDVWVNDAIAVIFAPTKEISPEDFRRSTEVCYLGAVYGTGRAQAHAAARSGDHCAGGPGALLPLRLFSEEYDATGSALLGNFRTWRTSPPPSLSRGCGATVSDPANERRPQRKCPVRR